MLNGSLALVLLLALGGVDGDDGGGEVFLNLANSPPLDFFSLSNYHKIT
jgi:hypothetical protein